MIELLEQTEIMIIFRKSILAYLILVALSCVIYYISNKHLKIGITTTSFFLLFVICMLISIVYMEFLFMNLVVNTCQNP
jgi:hypothetical protein